MISKLVTLKNSIAESASKHWLVQRITAIILIPLTFKLIGFLDLCMNAPYQETTAWLKSPLNTLYIEVWVIVTCYHAALGLQVVIEDYVANHELQSRFIKLVNRGFLFITVAALFFIFRIF
jgi:succinate dehydrogenase / fumarate reductase membrane anchor subunit